jgi:OmpA-OmpF porin, OOP family
MNKMNKTLLSITIVASLGISGQSFAQEDVIVNEAFVGDSRSVVVKDSAGDCVRTSSWSEDKKIIGCGAEPAPEPVAEAAPAPAPKVVTERVSLSAAALFAHDSAVFHRDAQPQLDEFAARVKALSSIQSVNIVGHTDSSGSDAYNQGLSERRAASVKNFLIEQGVDANIITTSGMGESQPVASNATAEGRAQNRRVEVSFTGTEKVQ